MRKLIDQALGREPEAAWMSHIGGLICAFGIPALIALACVAFGAGK